VNEFGADALRLYEMFMGPLEMVKPWSTKGVEGVYRFLGRSGVVRGRKERDGVSSRRKHWPQRTPRDAKNC